MHLWKTGSYKNKHNVHDIKKHKFSRQSIYYNKHKIVETNLDSIIQLLGSVYN